ncbi:sorting nexin-11 isoform X2 [Ranitomeya variabilis]|uniref:sorting nexin-11 isoform X2 n=1 Tax=Ranitomeya variabilis TaxID=490064 RepID=UPI004056B858
MCQNNPDEEEFITVRVQDPRLQNEGSWTSYVDYKIFLHWQRTFTHIASSAFDSFLVGLLQPKPLSVVVCTRRLNQTNSKAFTAKTSCVRRRYREFAWLRKQIQNYAGLVPVPALPGKLPFHIGCTDDFIETRRQGLQQFLEQTVQSMVLLSDSQLHLFLQSQLSVGDIEACVKGHRPYTATEAILNYAISNRGWTQEETLPR